LSRRGLDNCRLADSRGIKVDVGTFFGRFGSRVKVEKFYYIADKVR
jgi:hypothetical protein